MKVKGCLITKLSEKCRDTAPTDVDLRSGLLVGFSPKSSFEIRTLPNKFFSYWVAIAFFLPLNLREGCKLSDYFLVRTITTTSTQTNSLRIPRIPALIDTSAMRLNYPLSILATDCRFIKTSWPALVIANLFWSQKLNARLTNIVMALPQTVGFKPEAVDEEGVWCACTIEVDDDYVIVSFDGWNVEGNRRVCDPREIRDRTLPDRKRKWRNLPLQWTMPSL